MQRRDFSMVLGAALATSLVPGCVDERDGSPPPKRSGVIAMLAYPFFMALDLVGPQNIFAMMGTADVHLVWKTRDPITTNSGIIVQPTLTFDECPDDVGVLFVPGGGTAAILRDDETLEFLAEKGARAALVTSVCTGAMLLGAAGLLRGYRATTHWAYRDLLPLVGAEAVAERVVEDRNRITGGGVTAGIDFGLTVAARLLDQTRAEQIQLTLEYNPQPPFNAGSPETASAEVTATVRSELAPGVEEAREAAIRAAKKFG